MRRRDPAGDAHHRLQVVGESSHARRDGRDPLGVLNPLLFEFLRRRADDKLIGTFFQRDLPAVTIGICLFWLWHCFTPVGVAPRATILYAAARRLNDFSIKTRFS